MFYLIQLPVGPEYLSYLTFKMSKAGSYDFTLFKNLQEQRKKLKWVAPVMKFYSCIFSMYVEILPKCNVLPTELVECTVK